MCKMSDDEEVLSRARRSAVLNEERIMHVMYFVYITECKDGSLYTGITTNVERRFAEHKSGTGGHYTRSKEVVKIMHTERHPNRSSASKRESEIKGWTRQKKLNLIKSDKP